MMENEKKTVLDKTLYEHVADDPFYLFLKKEPFLLDEPHYHESLEIIYLMEGETKVHLNGTIHPLSQGEIFVCNRQQVHFYENYDESLLGLCVVLSNKYTHDFRQLYHNAQFPSFLRNRTYNEEIFSLLHEWFECKNQSFLVDCAFVNLLLDKIVRLYGVEDTAQTDDMNTMAIRLINYISEHYAENLSLESVAKHFGYSKEYFSKIFKQSVGKNFLCYLNETRAQKALEFMQDPQNKKSANEICAACGFNNTTSLYRHLKRAHTPGSSSRITNA